LYSVPTDACSARISRSSGFGRASRPCTEPTTRSSRSTRRATASCCCRPRRSGGTGLGDQCGGAPRNNRCQSMSLRFDLTTIPLPSSGEYVGTWGSSLVTHPEQPTVVLSLPRGAGPLPWVTVDLETGVTRLGKGLRGELRDGLASGDEALCLT